MRTICALLNSNPLYALFITYGDCFHLSDGLASGFLINNKIVQDYTLAKVNAKLMADLKANFDRKTISTWDGNEIIYAEFYGSKSKPIIDEIDRVVLAERYSFTDEELDFVINYDIKYRMGSLDEGGNEE